MVSSFASSQNHNSSHISHENDEQINLITIASFLKLRGEKLNRQRTQQIEKSEEHVLVAANDLSLLETITNESSQLYSCSLYP